MPQREPELEYDYQCFVFVVNEIHSSERIIQKLAEDSKKETRAYSSTMSFEYFQ